MRTSFRKLFVSLSIVGLAVAGVAAPFEKTVRFVQPDGATVELWGRGDEFHAVFETLDGYTVAFVPAAKAYYYAARSADGTALIPTALQVGKGDPSALGLAKHVRISADAVRVKARARFERWDMGTKNSERWRARKAAARAAESAAPDGRTVLSPPAYTTTGTKAGLCLLIDFSDATGTVSRAEIIDFCNGDAYAGYGNNGSVKKYYQDVSNGLLTYTNIVTVYIRMAQPKTYYNDTSKDCGDQGNLLIKDAVAIMKALPNYATEIAPAFANLTLDASGYVQACNVFYAGDDGGTWSYGLWPHSWSLYNVGPQTLAEGITLYPYQITNIGDSLELGTFCHENGHMLCDFPDIYDYDYDSAGGAGGFCLMNSGGHGSNPVQVCAYLKRASGWATTLDLTSGSALTATLSSSGGGFNTFYRYAKTGTATEYFLLENRQRAGRDANLPASGIAVWHIDELGDRDNQSLTNNTSHANYEVTLVQADNLWHFQKDGNSGDAQDLYYRGNAAAAYSNVFSDASAPCACWWDGSASGLNLSGFSASASVMTFNVQPPGLAVITASPLPGGYVGVPYSLALEADGGYPPYAWAVVSNALPSGLSLSGDGALSGTPDVAGTSGFAVRVTDASNATATATLSLTVNTPRGVPFEETFENNGEMPEGWTQAYVSNTTSWAFMNGGVEGHPSSAHGGGYNACLYSSGYGNITMLVSPMLDLGESPEAPQLTFWHCMQDWLGDQDSLRVYYKTSAAGEWILLAEYRDDVPDWTLRVLPLPETSRTFFLAFEGMANFGYGVCVDDVRVTTAAMAPLIVTPSPLPPGWVGLPYSQTLAAFMGTAPYTWSVVSNALPQGLSLSGDGVISGTPGTLTNVSFSVRVSGDDGLASTNLFDLAILAPCALPFAETFEHGGEMPAGWTQEYVTDTVGWQFVCGAPEGAPQVSHGGAYNACFYNSGYGSVTRLVSPPLDFGPAPQNVRLSFWHCMNVWDGDQDELRVYCRPAAGGEWSLLAEYTGNTSDWTLRNLMLPGTDRLWLIAFEGTANYGYGVCVDDVTVSAISPHEAWQVTKFTDEERAGSGIAGDADDPDGDGIPNLLEYAWGLEPRSADVAGFPVGGVSDPYLTLTYRRNKLATDLLYEVESCADLRDALWATNDVSEVSRADSNGWWSVTSRHNVPVTGAPRRFMRLKVTLP